ncbi:MAG: ATP-binding cassette domain-containing protein, partial [Lentisphaeria bacterium]|nr:ATP-binding cassette domain-containing protein [Lentisphaeria bacterium]
MSSNTPVLEVCKLNFSYHPDQPIISDANFAVMPGQSGCIVGPNGGGKTTLLKILLGLLKPDSGEVKIFGATPRAAGLKIGYMPQYHQLDTAFPVSALEVAMMGRITRKTL